MRSSGNELKWRLLAARDSITDKDQFVLVAVAAASASISLTSIRIDESTVGPKPAEAPQ